LIFLEKYCHDLNNLLAKMLPAIPLAVVRR